MDVTKAMWSGNKDFLKSSSDLNKFVLEHGDFKWTVLHLAAATGNVSGIEACLSAGSDPDIYSMDGNTPLHLASRFGNMEAVRVLLREGCEVDPKNEHGQTPLHFACANGHLGCVKRLITGGASAIIKENFGVSPLEMAVLQDHSEIVSYIRGSGNLVSDDDPMVTGLKTWLVLIGCQEHLGAFIAAGYEDIEFISKSGLDDDDLDAIGVLKLGHRKRLKSLFRIEEVVKTKEEEEEDDEEEEEEEEEDDEEDEEEGDE